MEYDEPPHLTHGPAQQAQLQSHRPSRGNQQRKPDNRQQYFCDPEQLTHRRDHLCKE